MSAMLTVSLVSFRFCANPGINLDRHGAWLEALAKSAGGMPDLVLFPEFSLTGWTYDADAALELDSPLVGRAVGLAAEFATAVGFGLVERCGGVRCNSFVVAGPDGVAGVMRKINLTPAECRHFSPGRELPVIEVAAGRLAGVRMGVATCADATRFEMIHLLSLRGAEVILAPHANSLAVLRRQPRRLGPLAAGTLAVVRPRLRGDDRRGELCGPAGPGAAAGRRRR